MAKKIISNILDTKRNWLRVDRDLPEDDKPVAIRYMDMNQILAEDENSVYPKEDLKIARWCKNDDGEYIWKIEPPYPLYDYSMLSSRDKLNQDTLVTHWSPVTDDELRGWYTRFQPSLEWKNLSVSCNREMLESLYKALIFSSFLLNTYSIGATDEKMKREYKAYERIILDLQACMDHGGEWTSEMKSTDVADKNVTSTESE